MSEIKVITQHAGTVLVGQLAIMAFGVADTVIAGRYSDAALGVWAAEGFENSSNFFGPSESLRLHYFNVGKGSGTPENVCV